MDSTSLLLLALKLAGLIVVGVSAVLQLRSSPGQSLTAYQRYLVWAMIAGLLFASVAEIVAVTQQLKSEKESDAREKRLLAEIRRLTRPLFPMGISTTWNVRVATSAFEPYVRLWAKLTQGPGRPDSWPLFEQDLPPKGTAPRQTLEQLADLEIRIYGADRTARNAFEQPDVLMYTGDTGLHDYEPNAMARQESFLAKRAYYYRRDGSVDFMDVPTKVTRGRFNSGVVAFEDDLLGCTIEIQVAAAQSRADTPTFRELTVHLNGERNLYISRSEFNRVRSVYGDWVYRAVVTPEHISRAAIMEP